MPLDTQQGEVADRLRRFLNVVGRIPSGLDETVVPVVSLSDLAAPPYRHLSPREGCGHFEAAATAAEYSLVGIGFPAGRTGTLRINQIWITVGAAMSVRIGNLAYTTLAATAAIIGGYPRDVELQTDLAAVTTGVWSKLPVDFFGGSDPTNFTTSILKVGVPAVTTTLRVLDPNTPILLQGGNALIVQGQTVNTALNVGIHCTWYEQPGDSLK